MDLLKYVDADVSMKIFSALEDLSDLVIASGVSRSWRSFLISNRLLRAKCLEKFPQLSRIERVRERSRYFKKPKKLMSEDSIEWENLETEHRVYAYFARAATTFTTQNCISDALLASSTDHLSESINNTLEPRDQIESRPSYWSSGGEHDPATPETLLYKLVGDICIVTEIEIQPFQAYFQPGSPIYSAEFVRFRLGQPKFGSAISTVEFDHVSLDDIFMWNYISPTFSMRQENRLQKFTFQQPVVCIGGYLQIELLGRVQRQQMDNLFYVCITYVRAMGKSLSELFGVEVLAPSDKYVLKLQRLDW